MKSFQDLQELTSEDSRAQFCRTAVFEFMASPEYRIAKDGEAYYNKHNLTIEAFKKMLTTMSGGKVEDIFSSNYKLKTLFFRRLVSQQVQYVLGNGLSLTDPKNKEKLGKDFDYKLQLAAKRAMAGGKAFGFWNYDHLEVFGYADTPAEAGFCPLYNEETAKLDAGIRYWFKRVGDDRVFRATLYETDGYTEYIQPNMDVSVQVFKEKQAYKQTTSVLSDGTIEEVVDENYGSLPIIPLYCNDSHESELVGIRECIDCYDFVKSGLANDIDDTSGFYWILKNTGGMNDTDLAKFVQRMKSVRAAVLDGDEGVDAEAHTMDIPANARVSMLEILKKDIYDDFQALNVETLSAAAKTTQEIQAAYQSQDNKCADFEYYIVDFVQKIMELAGIDDTPTFIWNRVVNQAEQTQMVLSAAQYLSDDVIIRHLPFLSPDEVDDILMSRNTEDFSLMNAPEEE